MRGRRRVTSSPGNIEIITNSRVSLCIIPKSQQDFLLYLFLIALVFLFEIEKRLVNFYIIIRHNSIKFLLVIFTVILLNIWKGNFLKSPCLEIIIDGVVESLVSNMCFHITSWLLLKMEYTCFMPFSGYRWQKFNLNKVL